MELEFTDDQETLRDSIRAVLINESPIGRAREVAELGTGADHFVGVAGELGWAALTVPERFGGIGLGPVEAGILAEELGRVVAPGPLLATVTQFVPLLDSVGSEDQRARWLSPIATDAATATVAVESTVALTIHDNLVVLRGDARYVVEASRSEFVAIIADNGARAVVAHRDELDPRIIESIDRTRELAHLHFDDLTLPVDRLLGGPGAHTDAIELARDHAACGLALETVGACQSIFDTALDYAKHRHQFGVPIGSFQALKHKFADMVIALERARATGYLAALCLAEHDPRAPITVSAAKAAAGDCQRRLAQEGIQILGGIGYTWEADMHFYVKRVKANDMLFGSASDHRRRIADQLSV